MSDAIITPTLNKYPYGLDNGQRFLYAYGLLNIQPSTATYAAGGLPIDFTTLGELLETVAYPDLIAPVDLRITSHAKGLYPYQWRNPRAPSLITAFSITSNVVTFTANNQFTAGEPVQVQGLSVGTYLNGQTLLVSSSGLSGTAWEAAFTNANVSSTTDSGFATPQPAVITAFSISSNVVTFTANNGFSAGDYVRISGLGTGTYLNGQILKVISTGLSTTQFEADFTHANVSSTADLGSAFPADRLVIMSASAATAGGAVYEELPDGTAIPASVSEDSIAFKATFVKMRS